MSLIVAPFFREEAGQPPCVPHSFIPRASTSIFLFRCLGQRVTPVDWAGQRGVPPSLLPVESGLRGRGQGERARVTAHAHKNPSQDAVVA